MAVKIRLQRHGRKQRPYYYIVVADSRSPRDGKFIERLGSYNPNTNPATIDVNTEKAVEWLNQGAQPTETCRNILSYKGVLYRRHLLQGVAKGAFDAEEADRRYQEWQDKKSAQVQQKVTSLHSSKEQARAERKEREAVIARKKAEEIMARRKAAVAEAEGEAAAAAEAEAETETETETEAAVAAEAEVQEMPKAAAEEIPVAEAEVEAEPAVAAEAEAEEMPKASAEEASAEAAQEAEGETPAPPAE